MSQLTARFDLPPSGTSPGAARRVVREVLSVWDYTDDEWLDQVVLVVSELVSNSLRHGGGCVGVDVQAHDAGVVIGVVDASSTLPRRRATMDEGVDGRGMFIIEALGAAWGANEHHGGKRVWVRMRPHPGRARPA